MSVAFFARPNAGATLEGTLTIMTLALQERTAWILYHAQTRRLVGESYAVVEPWAWAELQATLRAIEAKRPARDRVAA